MAIPLFVQVLSERRLLSNCTVLVKAKVKVVTADGQVASLSWNKAAIWGLRPGIYYCQTVAGLLMWGALSDERTGLSFARVTVSSNKSVVSMYNLHFTCYQMHVRVYRTHTGPLSVQAQYSRSGPIFSSPCYNSSLVN
jgi:hypothetical protein